MVYYALSVVFKQEPSQFEECVGMAVKQRRCNCRLVICFVVLSVLVQFGEGLRGKVHLARLLAHMLCHAVVSCCGIRVHLRLASEATAPLWYAGLGYPNRELFEDVSKPSAAPQRPSGSPAPGSTPSNSSAGLTMSGLKEELGAMKDKAHDYEHRHSKATIAAAATIGSLLLVSAVGCAGMWAHRRFVRSQHTGNKRSRADKMPYYDADRLLGDPAGL
jgi:hypothetical protein